MSRPMGGISLWQVCWSCCRAIDEKEAQLLSQGLPQLRHVENSILTKLTTEIYFAYCQELVAHRCLILFGELLVFICIDQCCCWRSS